MYDLFYNFLSQEIMLGSAMDFESTQILVRYLSIGLTIGTFACLCLITLGVFKWIKSWFI